jgi:hypothetical protein
MPNSNIKSKPVLKPIGSVVGVFGRSKIREYLNQQFASVGFQAIEDGLADIAKYKGTINGKEIALSFSLLKISKYYGINQDHQFRLRTFQGIRMRSTLVVNLKTRLVIAKKTKGKWTKRITHWVMQFKKFKTISNDYLGKEVYSPDELFAEAFINDSQISNQLSQLNSIDSQCISWGLILIPEQLEVNTTFANLDDFETNKLHQRLSVLAELAKTLESKPISKKIEMTKSETMMRENPKKLMWRGLWFILLYILLCVLLIGLMFFITVKFGQWPIIIIGITAYIIYKYV